MKKHVRQILYTSIALGVSLTAVSALESNVKADSDNPAQTQQIQQEATVTSIPTDQDNAVKQQTTKEDTTQLDQAEAQKQAQNKATYDQLAKQPSKTVKMLDYFNAQELGDFSEKPTDNFSPALAKKLYETRDARNEKLLAEGGDAKLDNLDRTMSMISDYTYELPILLPEPSWGLPKRTDNKNVPQDDQFYIDWLDHEVKLANGEKETYQVPASYTDLLKKFNHVASYYGGDDAKLSDSDYTRFGELPGFEDWDNITEYMVHLTQYPGKSEYDVKFYTPFLTDILNNWDQKHNLLKQEYAAKNSSKNDKPASDSKTTSTVTTVTTTAKNTEGTPTQNVAKNNAKLNIPSVQTAQSEQHNDVQNQSLKSAVITPQTHVANLATSVTKSASLPQTGNKNNSLVAVLGLGLLTLTTMFGFEKKRQF